MKTATAPDRPAASDRGAGQEARLCALNWLNQLVSSSLDVDTVLAEIAAYAATLAGAAYAAVWVADETQRLLVHRTATDRATAADQPVRPLRFGEGGVGWVAATRQRLDVADLEADGRAVFGPWLRAHGFRSALALPILHRDALLGVLALLGRRPFRLGPDDEDTLDSFVAQAAVVIHNAQVLTEREARRREAEVLAELARQISAVPDLPTVLERVAAGARELCRADAAKIALRVGDSEVYVVRYRHGLTPEGPGEPCEGAPSIKSGPGEDPLRDESAIAEMVVPIRADGRVEGLIYVHNRTERAFTDGDEAILARLADHAAIAVRNARLLEETERRRRESESLAELGRLVSRSLDPEEVGALIAQSVSRLLDAPSAALYRLDGGSGDATLLAAVGPAAAWSRSIRAGHGAIGLAIRERRAVAITDVLKDDRITLEPEARERIHSSPFWARLAVPVVVEERVIGALGVGGRVGRRFTDEEARLAQAFVDQASLALDNARLYAEAVRRRWEAEVLGSVGRDVAQSLDLGEVATRIADGLRALLGARAATLCRLDPESGALVTLATSGAAFPGDLVVPAGVGLLGLAVRERAPAVTSDILTEPGVTLTDELRELMERNGIRSALALPLVAGDRVVGAVAVGDAEGRRFGADEIRLARTFGDQATLALENAWLFDQAERRRRAAESLARLARTLTETVALEEVCERVVQSVLPLLRAPGACLRLLQPDGSLVAVAIAGVARARFAEGHALPPGQGVSGRAIALGRPFWSADFLNDHTIALPDEVRQTGLATGQGAALAAPLVVKDRTIGVLLACDGSGRHFAPDEVDLLQAFADQAAVAIENARLYGEAQRAYEELSQAQAELAHAQKMQAVGRLAGGVAHDFNNLLTVVHGRSELLLRRVPAESPLVRDIELIKETTRRATGLVQQLLAFSRKQVLQRQPLDLNEVVRSISGMLRHLIGEHVELVLRLAPELGPVSADRGQLEQVLVNLIVNARDAMPDGGALTLETADVEVDEAAARRHAGLRPGPYVMAAVHDTGCGMDAETRARIFEPFFTTKEPGKGTGLGLSMVYGLVKQHDGHVAVASAPGQGTTFRVYLPRGAEADAAPAAPTTAARPARPGCGTVLLVEDEPDVRELAREILESGQYTVLEASGGDEALALCRQHRGPIDLLLSDVVMPRMSGAELARRVLPLRPELRVVFMSGYTDDALGDHGVLDPGIRLLQKPFTPDSLLRSVRAAIDA